MDYEITLPKDQKVATIRVTSPPLPENAEDIIKENGRLLLSFLIDAIPTPEFEEWAKLNGIPFRLIFEKSTGIKLIVDTEDHVLWIKLRWN